MVVPFASLRCTPPSSRRRQSASCRAARLEGCVVITTGEPLMRNCPASVEEREK